MGYEFDLPYYGMALEGYLSTKGRVTLPSGHHCDYVQSWGASFLAPICLCKIDNRCFVVLLHNNGTWIVVREIPLEHLEGQA